MNFLILTRYPKEYEPERLKKGVELLGLKPVVLSYQKITLSGNKVILDNGKYSLSQFKYIVPRAASAPSGSLIKQKTALLKALSPDQVCLNKKSFLKYPLTGKILQGKLFSEKNISVVPSSIFYNQKDWDKFLETAKFPLIVKGAFGSHGKQVFAVKSKSKAEQIIDQQGWDKLIFQPLIDSPYWVRALVLNGEFLGAIPRKTKSRFFPSKSTDLPNKIGQKDENEIERISLKVAKILETDFAGLDFLNDNGNWLLLEINRTPQFKIFEKKTNINVAKKIIEAVSK